MKEGVQKGITLTEMLVAIVVASIIVLGAFQFYYLDNKGFVVQDKVVELQASASSAFRIMTDRIVEAGFDPTRSNAISYRFGFVPNIAAFAALPDQIGASTILWTQDDNGNGTVELPEVRGFKFENNRIYQLGLFGGTSLVWREFIGGIEGLTLTYYDKNGAVINPLTNFQDIRRVRVQVVAFKNIQPDPTIPADIYRRTLSADIIPRNRSF